MLVCGIRLPLLLEFLDDLVQLFEPLLPDVAITIEPVLKVLQGLRTQFVEPLLCTGLHLNQARVPKHLEVLRGLRLPKFQPDMDVVYRPRTGAEQFDDPKSIGFAQRGKGFSFMALYHHTRIFM